MRQPLLLLGAADVHELLDVRSCLAAVEEAFHAHASGAIPPAICSVHVDGGGFHVKAAALTRPGGRALFAAKVNANFPANPAARRLPTVQGLVTLFDAASGEPLALLDSPSLTALRTAAATAVAARWLAAPDATVATLIGCGVTGRAHLAFLHAALPLREVLLFDSAEDAVRGAAAQAAALGLAATVVADPIAAARRSDVIVTCTPSRTPLLGAGDVRPGSFVAGVGADNGLKHELAPALLTGARVVVDVLAQCRSIGDLHHALAAGALREDEVHAELGAVIAGTQPGRSRADETFVFDSTGMALQDVAAAAVVYERAVAAGRGVAFPLS
jgi:alanine dehydrogenase